MKKIKVKMRFIQKVGIIPFFKNTATGGRNIDNMIRTSRFIINLFNKYINHYSEYLFKNNLNVSKI